MTARQPPSELRIDQAQPQDWQRLRQIRLRALTHNPEAFGSSHADETAISAERWQDRLADRDTVFVIAHVEGVDVGLARLTIEQGSAGLFSMWVAPEYRGRGIGEALVSRVVIEARSRGHTTLALEVVESNAVAMRLYERCGFVPTGRTCSMPRPRSHITEIEMHLDMSSE
jgi:GNAT superfamily N-acetyltransferase